MSYDDTKVIELAGLVRSILSGRPEGPQLSDAVASAEALDAMVRSAAGGGWIDAEVVAGRACGKPGPWPRPTTPAWSPRTSARHYVKTYS